MSYKGRYKPKNPKKYRGDPTGIIYRSLLERSYMVKLDENPNVLEWQSEEIIVPYISPIDNAWHRYFPDFWVRFIDIDDNNIIKQALIELKPKSQCKEPKVQSRKTVKYVREVTTWLVNQAKWDAAIEWCKKNNCQFQVLTEEDIKPYGGHKYSNGNKQRKRTNTSTKVRTRRPKTPTR